MAKSGVLTHKEVQNRRRKVNSRVANVDRRLEHALSNIRDEDLPGDVEDFQRTHLPAVAFDRLLRAARVAKNPKTYEDLSRGLSSYVPGLVDLSGEEKEALVKEQDSVFQEPGMLIVILTVALAAFLQGHVQSSINSASLYHNQLGLQNVNSALMPNPSVSGSDNLALGGVNATPFFAAAGLGCWMALPLSDRYGRKGSMQIAAAMVFVTSLLMRMGIKAVNTPLLASETAIGYWRGTSIMAWQLWVACGIMVGFALNAVFTLLVDPNFAVALILGAPVVPSCMLLLALLVCPESPRYYMRHGPRYSPAEAYKMLQRLRRCELIAMRDVYVLYKSALEEYEAESQGNSSTNFISVGGFIRQYFQLFTKVRLRNALISCSIVALSQQLCGININVFYSGILVETFENDRTRCLFYSIGFSAVTFIFGLPAIRTIDTLGRRKWLVLTLPPMALLMGGAAASFAFSATTPGQLSEATTILGGCALAVSVNLAFAGLLSFSIPSILLVLTIPGCLGLFSVLTLVAFALIFLFVEETKQVSLEDLDFVYGVRKRDFMRFQVYENLPWVFKQYLPCVSATTVEMLTLGSFASDGATDIDRIYSKESHMRAKLQKLEDGFRNASGE
ncbi:hexose transporter [Thozetella sp. PMI_491]|nr:hexose transporter [Thozetella sp. PMI_491]